MPTHGKSSKQEFRNKHTADIVAELKRHRGARRHTSATLQQAVLGKPITKVATRTSFDRSRREAYAFLGKKMGGKWRKVRGTNGRYAEWEFAAGKAHAASSVRSNRRPLRIAPKKPKLAMVEAPSEEGLRAAV